MKIINPKKEHGIVNRSSRDQNYKYNGWPSVCRDDRNYLYAVASTYRLTHGDPSGKDGMWVSNNNGKTWSNTIIVNDTYFDDRDAGITYVGNGRFILTFYTEAAADDWMRLQNEDWFQPIDKACALGISNMWKFVDKDTREKLCGSFYKISDDYGMTWTESKPIDVFAPHGVSMCKDGRLIYLGKVHFEINGPTAGHEPVAMMTSFDKGDTWEMTGYVPTPDDLGDNMYIHEPHVVELPNGRLLGAMRVHDRPNAAIRNTVYITFSDDMGKTWSMPKEIPGIDGMPPHICVHSSGAVIVSYGCRTKGIRSERAVVSYDNGETWTEDYLLDDNINDNKQYDMGYPATVELDDGSLLTVYYQALPDDWHTSVLYTRWNLEK